MMSWWIYVLLAVFIFVVLILAHFVVKKINETRDDERIARIYDKTATSTQVQTILFDKGVKTELVRTENEERAKKTSPGPDKVSLVFSIDDNTKKYSPYTCKENDSWIKFLGHKGVTIYSKDNSLKSAESSVSPEVNLLSLHPRFNVVNVTTCNSNTNSRLSSPTSYSSKIIPDQPDSSSVKDEEKDIQDVEKVLQGIDSSESENKPKANISDNKEEIHVEEGLCGKFLGSIYFKDSIGAHEISSKEIKDNHSKDDTASAKSNRNQSNYEIALSKRSQGLLSGVPLSFPNTDIARTSNTRPILLNNATSRLILKRGASKVTFKSEVSEVEIIEPYDKDDPEIIPSATESAVQNPSDQIETNNDDDSESVVNYITLLNEDMNSRLLDNISQIKNKIGLKLMVPSEPSTSTARTNFKILVDHLTFCEDTIALRFDKHEIDKDLSDKLDGLQSYKKHLYLKDRNKSSKTFFEQSSRYAPLNISLDSNYSDEIKEPDQNHGSEEN